MVKHQGKYTDAFKKRLVLESHEDGTTVPMVSKRHGVRSNRIYSWRQDPRFQRGEKGSDSSDFLEVGVIPDTATITPTTIHPPKPVSDTRIEITLENGRKLSISEGVDAGFVLELARGLAA